MDSDDEYDEFGNYLGGDIDSGSENENGGHESGSDDARDDIIESEDEESSDQEQDEKALVKGDALSNTFGNVETILVDPLLEGKNEPIIKNVQEKKLVLEYDIDHGLPEVSYSREYMAQLSREVPERIRNVAFVGSLHTGKTSLIDLLVQQTHTGVSAAKKELQEFRPLRYLDTHKLENERGLSIGAKFITLLMSDPRDRSYVFNIADCPGHPDFQDEVETTLSIVEGVVFVIDLLEGFTRRDKRLLGLVIRKNLPFTVVLNKFDRLILELNLPPNDFYHKTRYVLDDINAYVHHHEYIVGYTHEKLVSPMKGNVVFSSTTLSACFTLETFADITLQKNKAMGVTSDQLAKILWGDFYMENGKFMRLTKDSNHKRTFVQFVLDPLYKLVSYSLTSDPDGIVLGTLLWDNFGLALPKSSGKQDPQTLLRDVFSLVFDSTRDFVSVVVAAVPDPASVLEEKLDRKGFEIGKCNSTVAEVPKLLMTGEKSFLAIARVYMGTIVPGSKLKVVDSEKETSVQVDTLYIPGGRYKVATEEVFAGSIVLISGISLPIEKACSLFGADIPKSLLHPIHYMKIGEKSVLKVAVEPEHPSELPKLVDGLRILSKCYISLVVITEESGEHAVLAPGELYLDCVLHDLRHLFPDYLAIRVSDPMVRFSETCSERSVTKITTYGMNKAQLSVIAEPVNDKKLTQAIESGRVSLAKSTPKILRTEFGWDSLAARSIWAFGPDDMRGPSILLDDTLDADKKNLLAAKDLICSGFKLAVHEGPLCGEPIRNCKFKILDAVLGSASSHLLPLTRNAVHTGFLTAGPKLMEPMYRVNVICTYKCVEAIHTLVGKRRGWTVSEHPVPATPLYEIEGYVPVIDATGLDTDIRLSTQGQAMCMVEFARWDVVPGDPLDRDCDLPVMKPVPRDSMARDFVMKTRRRKGLSGEPNLQKYLDPALYVRLKDSGVIS